MTQVSPQEIVNDANLAPQDDAAASNSEESAAPKKKYRELKQIYKPSDYVPSDADPYNPTLAGVLSVIPGVGQMVCGEIVRGGIILVGAAVIGIGTPVAAIMSILSTPAKVLTYVGMAGFVALDVFSIIDAVKIAKVKNLYAQDLSSSSVELNLMPSLDYIPSANGATATLGLTLALSF